MKAIFIAGLPGSGKSRYIKDIASNGEAKVFDDFKANAIDDNNRFPFSRRYVELINTLNLGKDCIISDIDFCRSEARREAALCVEELVQGVDIEWWFFENNPAQCHNNVV